MRIPTWLAALTSVMLLLAAGETSAQSPDRSTVMAPFESAVAGRVHLTTGTDSHDPATQVRGQSVQYGAPPGAGGFHPAYGNNNPAAIWPPNTPQSFQPSPGISPFYPSSVAQQSTFNRNGLWFKEILHRKRDYFFTLEYLQTGYRDPGDANIGAPTLPVNPVTNELLGFLISNHGLGGEAQFGPGDGDFGALQRVVVGPGVLPFPAFTPTAGALRTFRVGNFAFPVRTLDAFKALDAHGIRSRWGYENEDGTGLMLTGWYGGLGQDLFQLGRAEWNGIPITQDLILANTPDSGFAPIFPRNGVLPLEFAEGFETGIVPDSGVGALSFGISGFSQKFDVLFQTKVETRAFGSTLNLYHEPIYKKKWVTVRPTYGARYIYVDDRFGFRGIDSGLGYEVDGAGGIADGGGGGAAGGAGTAPTFRPDAGSVHVPTDANDAPIDLFFEAILQSQVDSHLAGPEAGIRYDFGQSENFSIWGQSTFALLANSERVKIEGENIGDPLHVFLFTGVNFTDPSVDASFTDERKHTHASPMFEQSIFVEANVLKFVPLINKVHLLEQAQFQAGFTYMVIGQMARPGESIKWKAFPDTPKVNIEYQTWSMYNWSLGVHWTY